MIDVVIMVADPIVRRGLQSVFEDTEECITVAAAAELDELDGLLSTVESPILLLDVNYRRGDESLIRTLSEKYPTLTILMYVRHGAGECALRHFFEAGGHLGLSPEAAVRLDDCCLTSLGGEVRGCVGADSPPEAMVRSVIAASNGEIAAAPWLEALVGSQMNSNGNGPGAITPRELEVMALLAKGSGNKQIAKALGISVQTVKNHVARVMEKLGMGSRSEVGILAAKLNVEVRGSAK
jgi:DNA-binding NarL/FixJ family response regulator